MLGKRPGGKRQLGQEAGAGAFPGLCPTYLTHAMVLCHFSERPPTTTTIALLGLHALRIPTHPCAWAFPATIPEGSTWAARGEVMADGGRSAGLQGSQMGLSRTKDSWV